MQRRSPLPSATSLMAVVPQGHPRNPPSHFCLTICFLTAAAPPTPPAQRGHVDTSPGLRRKGVGLCALVSLLSVFSGTPVQWSHQKLEETWEHEAGKTGCPIPAPTARSSRCWGSWHPASCRQWFTPAFSLCLLTEHLALITMRCPGPPRRTSQITELVSAKAPKPASQGAVGNHLFFQEKWNKLFHNLDQFNSIPCIFSRTLQVAKFHSDKSLMFLNRLPSLIPFSLIVLGLRPREREVSHSESSEFSDPAWERVQMSSTVSSGT